MEIKKILYIVFREHKIGYGIIKEFLEK